MIKTVPNLVLSRNAVRSFFSAPVGIKAQSYTIRKSLQHSSDTLFKVISNVSDYHKFVPYCTESFVDELDNKGLPLKGGLKVGFKAYNERFVCKINCDNSNKLKQIVEAESLSDNLFDHLKMKWVIFQDANDENLSRMKLHLSFQFSNPLYNAVSALFADEITNIMVKAFSERAAELSKRT